jgi:hypothetical protein
MLNASHRRVVGPPPYAYMVPLDVSYDTFDPFIDAASRRPFRRHYINTDAAAIPPSFVPGFLPGLRFIRGPLVSVLAYQSQQPLDLWSNRTRGNSFAARFD